jgi:hypothetical protein
MTHSVLTSGVDIVNKSKYVTASFFPTKDNLVLVFVMNVSSTNVSASIPTLIGNGLTWSLIQTATCRANNDYRLSCFRAVGSAPTIGQLEFDFAGQTQTQCAWSIFQYDGINVSGENGANAIVQIRVAAPGATAVSSISLPLNPFQDAAKNLYVGGAIAANALNQNGFNQAIGFTQIHVQRVTEGDKQSVLETQEKLGESTSVVWNIPGATTTQVCAIAIELRAASVTSVPVVPVDVEALARRFEPILYIHPDEKWFPSDAKRYIEKCALWRAENPIDQKDSWGGKGQPFNRVPLIARGQIAAVAGEPGAFLGPMMQVPQSEERFLELNGWKNKADTPEPAVTQTSENLYANREGLATLYNNEDNAGGDKALRDSRFWYHAEALDTERLKQVLGTVRAPDLRKVLDDLKNPVLLCYYLFFPGHEEGLAAPCNNVEASEFASYAGDWSCVAILLERADGSTTYTPSFIGFSGRPLPAATVAQGGAKRANMKVVPYVSVSKTEEHPKLFVALSTHSLYTAPGSSAVLATGSASFNCGRAEVQPPIPPKEGSSFEGDDIGVFILKMAATAKGFGLLGSLVPAIVIAGLAWGLAELVPTLNVPFGIGPFDDDPPAPDLTAGPGNLGTVIHPVGMAINDEGAKPQPWIAQQGLEDNNRRYDFLVDRQKQAWWTELPSDTGQDAPGQRFLFGPAVTNDPNGRRRGTPFPEFWRSFFLAFADGKEKKLF